MHGILRKIDSKSFYVFKQLRGTIIPVEIQKVWFKLFYNGSKNRLLFYDVFLLLLLLFYIFFFLPYITFCIETQYYYINLFIFLVKEAKNFYFFFSIFIQIIRKIHKQLLLYLYTLVLHIAHCGWGSLYKVTSFLMIKIEQSLYKETRTIIRNRTISRTILLLIASPAKRSFSFPLHHYYLYLLFIITK